MSAPDFTHHVTVRLRETDAAGVVFFARYFDLLHTAFEAMLEARGLGVGAIIAEGDYALPIVHAECDYGRPLRAGDAVAIHIAAERVGKTSFTLRYTVERGGAAVSRAKTVHVCVDLATGRKRALPEPVTAALAGPPAGP